MTHAVIFDIDGTLLDSQQQDEDLYKEAVESVLGKVNFRAGLQDYDHVTDAGILLQVFADNDLEPTPDKIDAIKRDFFARLEDYVDRYGPFREMPGAKSILDRLRNSESHATAIATGSWRRSTEIKLSTSGFDVNGVPLATSDDAINRAEIMQLALKSLGAKFESVTYFGDGLWDRQACENLGWTFRAVGPVLNGLSSYDGEFVG